MTDPVPPTADRPRTIFVSYSHKDEKWKDRLLTHLGALRNQARLSVWHDRDIRPGDEWFPTIQEAMEAADIAILLITPAFLASTFIQETEVPYLLKRHEQHKRGLCIFPVLATPCDWEASEWLIRQREIGSREPGLVVDNFL